MFLLLLIIVAVVAILGFLATYWPFILALAIIVIIVKIVRSGGSKPIYKSYPLQETSTPVPRPRTERPAQVTSTSWKYSKNQILSTNNKRIDVPGVYILHNVTRNIFYVGQSKHILSRAKKHLEGTSHNKQLNRDIFAGHTFNVELKPLNGSGFSDLNNLEMYYINQFNAATNGYNKTVGNRVA